MPAERPLIAAVIYNRLHDQHAARDRRDAALRPAHPADEVDPQVAARRTRRRTTRALHQGLPPTPIANPGLASLQAAAHPAKVDYLYYVRKPDHKHDFFTQLVDRLLPATSARTATAVDDAHVALLGHPVAHSLSPRDAERGVRRGGPRLGLRGVRRRGPGRRGRARCVTLGFAGANVTIPHKQARRRRVRRGRGRRREHARLPRRPRARLQHRQGDPRRHRRRPGPA